MTSKPMLTLMCMPSQLSTKTEFLTVIMRVWWRNMLEGRGGGREEEKRRKGTTRGMTMRNTKGRGEFLYWRGERRKD